MYTKNIQKVFKKWLTSLSISGRIYINKGGKALILKALLVKFGKAN